jgi:hypothetical protein
MCSRSSDHGRECLVSDESVREWLTAQLTPLLPGTWRIIPNQRIPETLDVVTVVLVHQKIKPLPEAQGCLTNAVTLTVIDPHTDATRAEDALDDEVLALVTAIESNPQINFTEARKVSVNETYLGWDVDIEVLTQKESQP